MSRKRTVRLSRREVLQLSGTVIAGMALTSCASPAPTAAPTAPPAKAAPTQVPATPVPQPTQAPAQPTAKAPQPPVTAGPNTGLEDLVRLTDTPVEMRGWALAFVSEVPELKSWNDQVFHKKMAEITNVKINWEHGSADPQVNAIALLMAGGNLPDFICGITYEDMNNYALQGAFEPLDDYIAKHSPWLSKLIKERPEVAPFMTAADGKMYRWPRLSQDNRLNAWTGFCIRQDWLDELKLQIPTTTDELYETLKAFKKQDAKRIPMAGDPRMLIWQWGVGSVCTYQFVAWGDFAVDGGKVKYGPIQPQYREAMLYLNKLYKEQLLDAEFTTRMNNDKETELLTSGLVGLANPSGYNGFTAANALWAKEAPNKRFIAMHPPKGPYGHQQNVTIQLGIGDGPGGGVMAKTCKYKELLARYVDLYYSPSGSLLSYWGTYGDWWTYDKDGKMVYTERYQNSKIKGNVFVRHYIGPQWQGPMLGNAEATAAWAGGWDTDVFKRRLFWAEESNSMMMPPVPLPKKDSDRVKALMGDINTLVSEYAFGFITGAKSLDKDYNDFVAKLRSLGIDEVTSIQQAGYDRILAALKKARGQ